MKALKLTCIILALICGSADAASLFPSFQGDVARTLPRGRFMLSYARGMMGVQDQFSGTGQSESIAGEIAQKIRWSDIVESETERSAQLGGLLDAYGVDRTSDAGELVAAVDGRVDLQVPVIGYGLTDRLGLFVAIPIQRVRLQSRVAYRKSSAAEGFANALASQGQSGASREFAESLSDGFNDGVKKAGYRPTDSIDQSGVGDVRLEIPYMLPVRQKTRSAAIIGSVVLPTGDTLDPYQLYPVAAGTGRTQLGIRGVVTQDFSARWQASVSGGSLVPLPARNARRVPRHENDRISPDVDEEARVSGGAAYQVQAHGRYRLRPMIWTAVGLQHQRRFRESWNGDRFGPARYGHLGSDTHERLESVFANVELNTINAFLAQKFPFPIQLNGAVAVPLAGRNTLNEILAIGQTTLYF